MKDHVKKLLEKLALENSPRIIEGEEAAEVYRDINEKMWRARLEFNKKNADSIEEASRCYITC